VGKEESIKGDNESAIRENAGKMCAVEVSKWKREGWQEMPIIWGINTLDKMTSLQKSGLQGGLEVIKRTEKRCGIGSLRLTIFLLILLLPTF